MPTSSRSYRILHLSDTHVGADGSDEDGVDAVRALDSLLASLDDLTGVDLVLVTGDVADDGSAAGLQQVLDRVGGLAARLGVPHVWTTGNHDARRPFAEVLGSGHRGPDGSERADSVLGGEERVGLSHVQGLRVVTLDSLVPGRTHGLLSQAQLAWLAGVLAEPAPDGTIVALHHPPIHLPDRTQMRDVVLQRGDDLAEVVRDRDVHAILCGHLHHQLSGHLAGVPVHVAPGVVTRIDLSAPTPLVRGVLGAGALVVDVGSPYGLMTHLVQARDPRAGEPVYVYDAVSGRDVRDS